MLLRESPLLSHLPAALVAGLAVFALALNGCSPASKGVERVRVLNYGEIPPCLSQPELVPDQANPALQKLRAEAVETYERVDNLFGDGKRDEAMTQLQDLLRKQNALLGADCSDSAQTLVKIGELAGTMNQPDISEPARRKVLEIRKKYLGVASIDTAEAVLRLAEFLVLHRRAADAVQLTQTAWDEAQKHDMTASARACYLYALSVSLEAQGQFEKAYETAEEACKAKEESPEAMMIPPKIYTILSSAARIALKLGKYDACYGALQRAVRLRYHKPQFEDNEYLQLLANVGNYYKATNNYAAARKCLEASLDVASSESPRNPGLVARFQAQLNSMPAAK